MILPIWAATNSLAQENKKRKEKYLPQTEQDFVKNVWHNCQWLSEPDKVARVVRSNFNLQAIIQALRKMRVPKDVILQGLHLARIKDPERYLSD